MTQRYVVRQTPDRRAWAILDRHLDAFCALPDSTEPRPNLLPLEWGSRAGAEAWLHGCFIAWERWEGVKAPAPKGWKPFKPEPSPWDWNWYDN
jgi:hypothetical protein